MKRLLRSSRLLSAFLLAMAVIVSTASAAPTDPTTGKRFKKLIAAQDVPFQHYLESLFSESDGYLIIGPIDPLFSGKGFSKKLYNSVRIICPDLETMEKTLDSLRANSGIIVDTVEGYLHQPRQDNPVGYRGIMVESSWEGTVRYLQINTVGQTRWLLWAHNILAGDDPTIARAPLAAYSQAVSDHLYAVDRRWDEMPTKNAVDFGVLDTFDLYRTPPDYVISGYRNYKSFLARHAGLATSFTTGVKAFIPTDSLMLAIKSNAPKMAWPNKEKRLLQHEYLEFLARGGDMQILRTLSKEVFDSLKAGEYFYAVGLSGKIRFGRRPPLEKVMEIELSTGKKIPRANHAFLFHGQPVLTAGTFFIEADSTVRMTKVTIRTGHYFFSNVASSVREDIAVKSNEYIWTLGHFFSALDGLKIRYDDIIIRKY
ncbi:MAG: hypothetical protein GY841_01695 [FCB group bacterium]|nr:hypothetical protein [FCB group bacterium]